MTVGQRNADGWESPSAPFGAAGEWQMSARPARTNLRGQVRHTGHGRRSKLKARRSSNAPSPAKHRTSNAGPLREESLVEHESDEQSQCTQAL